MVKSEARLRKKEVNSKWIYLVKRHKLRENQKNEKGKSN